MIRTDATGSFLLILLDGDVGRGKLVTATFENDDPQSLFQFLASEWSLDAQRDGENWVIRKP